MSVFEPINGVRESYVRFCSATERYIRAHSHFLVVWFGLQNSFLFHTQHTLGRCVSVYIRRKAHVDTTIGHC